MKVFEKLKRVFYKIVPNYAVGAIIVTLIFNFLVFCGTKPITESLHHYEVYTPIDSVIPLVPAFVTIYLLAFVQWMVGYLVLIRKGVNTCNRTLAILFIAKCITLIAFLVFPTTIARPDITSGDIFSRILKLVYTIDTPYNLFPSIHCLESWIVFRESVKIKDLPRWYKVFTFVMTLLVFASTLCLKQHVFIDIPAAIITVEIAAVISRKLRVYKLFAVINKIGTPNKWIRKRR